MPETEVLVQPGDFGLTKIKGLAGAFVNFGQWLIGDFAPVQHALVYVGQGMIVQAMPGGAEMIPLEDASPVVKWSSGLIDLTAYQRQRIVQAAVDMVGTPYSYLDYLSLALAHFRIRPKLIRDYVASTGHLICSQLVCAAYEQAGVDLFPDHIPGDSTPGDLWRLLKQQERKLAHAV